jgi:hypothetical protein
MGRDSSLSTRISDTYSTPISSHKYDLNKCNTIDNKADDPHFNRQKCMHVRQQHKHLETKWIHLV